MKIKFKNKLKMVDQTIETVDNNCVIIANIPALILAHNLLKHYRTDIGKALNTQVRIITGITKDKKRSKQACTKIASKVSKALSAYAHSIKNDALFDVITYSKSELTQFSDEILIATVEIIFNTATEYATEIEDFGIDADSLTALNNAVVSFKSKKVEPKAARDARKECTGKLNVLFPKTMDLLKNQMDKLVDVLGDEHETFKTLYKDARNIIDYNGPRHKPVLIDGFGMLFGKVINSMDSGAIEDAYIMIVELGLNVMSDEEGFYYFEKVAPGIYTLKITASTYVAETITNVVVEANNEVSMDIALNSDEGGIIPPPIPPVV